MNEISAPLVEFFSRSHPIAQVAVLLLLIALFAGGLIINFRGRWHHQRTREQRDQYLTENQELKRKLDQAKERTERLARKHKAEEAEMRADSDRAMEQLQADLAAAQEKAARYQHRLRDALPAFNKVRYHNTALLKEVEERRARERHLEAENDALLQRFDDLQKIDADVWMGMSVNAGKRPPFVGRDLRRARFVTFLNLKGGVGKTTLVANLAAAFATGVLGEKKRVLVVDLDYQGTLSNRCVDRKIIADRRATRRTADRLIDSGAEGNEEEMLQSLLVPMNGAPEMGFAIIADEHLDHADFRKQAIFAAESSEVRFEHRRWFHQPGVFAQFDFVFFDCPPRLTTSSINAMTCSDWIVIPTGPDPNDVEAVPRTLRWFDKLRTQAHIDFHAQLAGIILNSTYHGGTIAELTKQECNALRQLRISIQQFMPTDAAILKHVIKDDNAIARAAENTPFGTTTKGHELFGDVARELYDRIKN